MTDPGTAPYDVGSPGPGSGVAAIRFVTAGAGVDPTDIEDEDGILESVVHDATGVYLVTLNRQWLRLAAFPQILDATGGVLIKSIDEDFGHTQVNDFKLQVEASGVAADTTGKTISVILHLRTTFRDTS